VIISVSLMAVVLGSAYACLNAGFSAQKLIYPRTDALQKARVALAIITSDLRAACVIPGGYDFIGFQRRMGDVTADNIDFATHNYSPAREQEGDFCEVSYYLDQEPKTGQISLWRRVNPMIGMDPTAGGQRQQLVTGVRGLRFEYYDGFEWFDSWGDADLRRKREFSTRLQSNLSGLPDAVRITLLIDPGEKRISSEDDPEKREPPLVFRTAARLILAPEVYRRTSQSSSANTSTGSPPGQPAQPARGTSP